MLDMLLNWVVFHYLQLLSSEDDDVKEQTMWATGNIAGDSIMLRDYLLELNIMKHIVETMMCKCYKVTLHRNGKLC